MSSLTWSRSFSPVTAGLPITAGFSTTGFTAAGLSTSAGLSAPAGSVDRRQRLRLRPLQPRPTSGLRLLGSLASACGFSASVASACGVLGIGSASASSASATSASPSSPSAGSGGLAGCRSGDKRPRGQSPLELAAPAGDAVVPAGLVLVVVSVYLRRHGGRRGTCRALARRWRVGWPSAALRPHTGW